MGIAITALRAQAKEEFPGLDIDLENGQTLSLLPVTELSDKQIERFTDAQTKLTENDESEDLKNIRASFVSVLSELSTDPAKSRKALAAETLGTLIVIFRMYSETVSSGSKSEDSE